MLKPEVIDWHIISDFLSSNYLRCICLLIKAFLLKREKKKINKLSLNYIFCCQIITLSQTEIPLLEQSIH